MTVRAEKTKPEGYAAHALGSTDILVLIAALLVAVAVGAGLHVQAGLPAGLAIAAGATLFALAGALHILRGAGEPARPQQPAPGTAPVHGAPAFRTGGRVHGPEIAPPPRQTVPPMVMPPAMPQAAPGGEPAATFAGEAFAEPVITPLAVRTSADAPVLSTIRIGAPGVSRQEPRLSLPVPGLEPDVRAAPVERGASVEPVLPASRPDSLRAQWSFRPSDAGFDIAYGDMRASPGLSDQNPFAAAVSGPSRASAPPTAAITAPLPVISPHEPVLDAPVVETGDDGETLPPLTETVAPRKADVDLIESLIKKMADEVKATEQRAAGVPPPLPEAVQGSPSAPELPRVAVEPMETADRTVGALRLTAETMRAHTPHSRQRIAPPPLSAAAPEAPAAARASSMIDRIADAISADRAEVLLEPIVGLADQRAHHYEVSVRLRDEAGAPLALEGHTALLSGTGLLPLFDRVRTARAAQVARRLAERGKPGAVFSAMAGESLGDVPTVNHVTRAIQPERQGEGAAHLVLTFTASEVRTFAAAEWSALAYMRGAGFAFALTGVTDLDMDFAELAKSGFLFVRLDAEVLLTGLPAPHGPIPARDVCGYLAGFGLTVIAGGIGDAGLLAGVAGLGAGLGQGGLFGAPRPMKADAVARTAAA